MVTLTKAVDNIRQMLGWVAIMKVSYQLLRILACVSASVCYILYYFHMDSSTVGTVLFHVLVSYQALFFMLSGRFLLDKYDGNILGFYWRRFYKIVIPFLFASFVALICKIGFSVSLGFAKDFIKGVCLGNIEEAYGFMYGLFVFYLVVPFLSVMVKALSRKEKQALLYLLIGYFVLFDLCVVLDLRLFIVTYPFLNLIGYALIGYLIDHIDLTKKAYWKILIAGVIALFVSVLEKLICPDLNWALDTYCLTRALMCLAIYLFVTKRKLEHENTNKVIGVLGRATYYVALVLPVLVQVVFS